MKKLLITLSFLIALNVFSQEKNMFKAELNEFVLQCENIGNTIIDKNITTDLTRWFEGRHKEIAETNIEQLESDIDNSLVDVTYHMTRIKEEPLLLYKLHFFNKVTNEEFGELFIYFKVRENNLVDYLTFIGKEKFGMIDLKIDKN